MEQLITEQFITAIMKESVFAATFIFVLFWYLRDVKSDKKAQRELFATLSSKFDELVGKTAIIEMKIQRQDVQHESIEQEIHDLKLLLNSCYNIINERITRRL